MTARTERPPAGEHPLPIKGPVEIEPLFRPVLECRIDPRFPLAPQGCTVFRPGLPFADQKTGLVHR